MSGVMAMPAPVITPAALRPEPQLRVVKAMVQAQERAATSISSKVMWFAAAVALGIVLVLVLRAQGERATDPDQAWFWTPEWLVGELEADRDIAAGRSTHYDSDEALLASLEARLDAE